MHGRLCQPFGVVIVDVFFKLVLHNIFERRCPRFHALTLFHALVDTAALPLPPLPDGRRKASALS